MIRDFWKVVLYMCMYCGQAISGWPWKSSDMSMHVAGLSERKDDQRNYCKTITR